tara:strand:+ start:1017 stop:1562 length:546 start_codon:yes stop_codon:yes gene_type:complete
MKILTTKFKDVKLFNPTVYSDDRGFFVESFNQKIQDELNVNFLQDNHSKSKQYVIRGLHYQWDNPMGKLLRVVSGAGIDVILDIRKNSPTYGEYESFKLTDSNFNILWVPPGFAQGFLALEKNTHLCYKTTALHNGEAEGAIHPLKSGLDINWGVPSNNILLSKKDTLAQNFNQYNLNPKF